MRQFFRPATAPEWLGEVLNSIRGALSDEWPTPFKLAPYTAANVPPAAGWRGGMIYVTDETGGNVPAFSDGINWRRVTDRAVIAAFSPAALTTTAWYDPSDLSTLWQDTAGTVPVAADGDPVARMDDKSGNGNHLTQGTAANCPVYKAGGYLLFDGTNDGLASASGRVWANPSDVFIGLQAPSDTTWVALWDTTEPGTDFIGAVQSGSGSTATGAGAAVTAYAINGTGAGSTRASLYTAIGTNPAVLEAQQVAMAFDTLGIGNYGGFEFGGNFYGMVILPQASADDRTLIRQYLASKSGATLP